MPTLNTFKLALYVAALLLTLTCLVYTLIQKRIKRYQNVIFVLLLGVVIFNSITEIVVELCIPKLSISNGARQLFIVCQYLYFLTHTLLATLFLVYECSVTGVFKKITDRMFIIGILPVIFMEFLVILNPFFYWVYWYDEALVMHRNWGEMLIYIGSIIYVNIAIFSLFRFWRALTPKKRTALVYFIGIVFLGVIIQLLYFNIRSELLSEALAFLGMMLAIENEDEWMDADTGVYNRKALKNEVNTLKETNSSMTLLCVKIPDVDGLQRKRVISNTDRVSEVVGEYLKTIVPRDCIYNLNPGQFFITFIKLSEDNHHKIVRFILRHFMPKKKPEEVARIIADRFDEDWEVDQVKFSMNVRIGLVDFPEQIKDVDDIYFLSDSPIRKEVEGKIISGSDLDFILRRNVVKKAIERGLSEKHFEVFYQPTYYINAKLHGAEALVRLKDPELGMIFPDEFIPIAEQVGLIEQLDEFVLSEVCEFLESGVPQKLGVEYISVNLSMLQCIKKDFVARTVAIVNQYKIDKKQLNFEITETVAADDYDKLSQVIREMKEQGFEFSMDDYGTGYSNMHSIFSLDFDIIKIDKSILWGAEKSNMGRVILENSVRMIREMQRQILVEGVETEAQMKMLAALAVDYLQGYYFSKPVPKDVFLDVIRAKQEAK